MAEHRFGTAQAGQRPPAVPVETKEPFAFVHINKCGGTAVELALGLPKNHLTAVSLRDEMGADEWARRFTFAVVRNPFDRVVSIYFYRVRTGQSNLGGRHLNINQWVERVWAEEDPAYLGNAVLVAPAFAWVSDGDDLIVDEVLKLEDLDQEWKRVAERLGVTVRPGVVNANSHPPYQDLLSPVARKTLQKAFAQDMDRFGYRY
ncbi:MAG: sulfotransferase family 2 domain-containing protein [Pseudomonadota bacterium]